MDVSKKPRLRLLAGIAPVLVGGLLAFASAAGGELTPSRISLAGASGAAPQIASDGHGNIVAVWRELDGDESSIRAAVKPSGEDWGSSTRISRPAVATESAALAMDRLGNAVAVWNASSNGHDSVVQTAVRPSGGAWSAPANVSAPGDVAFKPSVAVEAGNVTAVWLVLHGRQTAVVSASRTVAGTWTAPETVSGPIGNTFAPVVALADDGAAVAAWQWNDGAFLVVQAASRAAGGTWSAPEALSTPGRSASRPTLVMDAKGNAIAGWIRSDGAWATAQVDYRTAGGTWGPPANLSNRGGTASVLDLAMTRAGDAVATWNQKSGRYGNLWSSMRPAGAQHWGSRVEVTDRWIGLQPQVTLDDEGNATAVWTGSATVSASFKPVGEAWQENYLLSNYDDNAVHPVVTAQSARNATAVWVALGDEDDRIQSVSYDIDTSAKEHAEEDDPCADPSADECTDECDDSSDDGCDDAGDDGGDDGEMLMGTPHADTIVGTPGNDVIYGLGGNDFIDGRGGHDVVYGGAGDDRIVGGNGADRLLGGPGRDRISAGRGNDRLVGGSGRDVLRGNSGNDALLAADRHRDKVFGGPGLDHFRLDRWLDRARSIESRL